MQDAALEREPEDEARLPTPVARRGQQLAAPDPRMQALATLMRGMEGEGGEEKQFSLVEYWHVLVKRKWTVIGLFVIAVLTGFMMTMLSTPLFQATATIQIDRPIEPAVGQSMNSEQGYFDYRFYETQFQLLRSRSMSEKVAARFDPNDPVFSIMAEPSPFSRLMNLLTGAAEQPQEEVSIEQKRSRLAGLVRGGMGIDPVKDSRLVRIHFISPDPRLSASVANAIAESFIQTNMDRRVDNSSYAREFLEDRLEQVRVKLEDSERALAQYAQREQIAVGNNESLLSQDLEALNAALTQAKQERIDAETKLRQVQGMGALAHPMLLQNEGVQALRSTRGKLEAEYQEKRLTYKEGYPLMQQLRSQIEQIDLQLEREVKIVREGLLAGFEGARQKEAMLEEQVKNVASQVLDVQARRASVTVLEREVETNRQLYDALLQRYKEIGISSTTEANNVSIVDQALPPGGPFSPNLIRNLMMAMVVGLVIGIALAFLFEYLDDTLKRPEEIEKHLGIGVLGVIPKLDGSNVEEALEDPRSAFSEAYRSVRTSLQFSTEQGVPKVLLVTSSSSAEGKSTTAITLAKNLAQLGKRVLLIDGDLRNPSLHRSLGSENAMGLSNYLAGGIKPAAAIRPTKQLRLTFIPSGPLPPNPAELLAGPKMMSLLSLAAEKFDQVIIDGPPVMGLADAPILANIADGTLLVVEAGVTRIAMAKATLKRLMGARAHVVGALLTKFDARVAGYGYGGDYSAYHYYSYGGADTTRRLGRS
jgi:capsular exopolysaccharide synthesis family protein